MQGGGPFGVRWDSESWTFKVLETKQAQVRAHARILIFEAARGRRWVGRNSLRSFVGVATALLPALPLALMYASSLNDAVADFPRGRMRAARAGDRTRLSGRTLKDLKCWTQIGEGGRVFVDATPEVAVNTDAAELGWGGKLGEDEEPGAEGEMKYSGVWTAEARKESIMLRELKAVTLVLGRELGVAAQKESVKRLRLYIDNLGAKFIIRRMTSRSKTIMREVRVLQRLLEKLGLSLDPHWPPSAQNYFADKQSRTWDPGDLIVRECLRRELLAKHAHVLPAGRGAWQYRPLGIHPVAARKVTLTELGEKWGSRRARLYSPPVDLVSLRW